jgi:two-component system, NarL family, invasion response regulator UvrY
MKKYTIQNLLLIEDHSIVRRGIKVLLNRVAEIKNIEEANTFDLAIDFCEEKAFNFIVLDVNLPGGDSTKMIKRLRNTKSHKAKILVFSSYEANIYADAYLQSGADGYLNKLSPDEEFIRAVETILKGKTYVPAKEEDGHGNPLKRLSIREANIAKLLVNGLANGEIQQRLDLKPSTISTYKNRVFEKLKVDNIPSLINMIKKYDVHGDFSA